jgi:F-type H+-transporting ATPase subunit b
MIDYAAIALWSQVIAAVLFAGLIVMGFVKFITPAIEKATAAKNEEIRESERRRDQALKDVEAARAALAQAVEDGKRISERIRHDARMEAQNIMIEANADAERLLRNARGELARCRLAARDRLRIELIERALSEARAIAAQRIDADTDTKLVDRFIGELERGAHRNGG